MNPIETIETDFATFELLPRIILMRCHAGINLGLDQLDEIRRVVDRSYELDPSFTGWISDKVNSYSTDPLVVPPIQKDYPFLRSWCNVVYGRNIANYAPLFKAVSVNDFGINSFDTLPPAIEWTYEYLKNLDDARET